MAGNLLRGSTQIMPQTITQSLLDPAIAIPDSYLLNGANFIKKDGSVAFTGNVSMGSNKLTGLANGTANTDAINLGQLLTFANGLTIHNPRLVSVVNINSLTGTPLIDGVTPTAGDEVLLTAQATQSQNGPWIVGTPWVRPAYFATGSVESQAQYFIVGPDGSNTYRNTKWYFTNTSAITVDTTSITLAQDQSGITYNFSGGLTASGNSVTVARGNGISLDGSNNITVTADPSRLLQTVAAGIGIKDGTAGQLVMANSAGNASYQTMSGDVTITSSGVTAVNHTAGTGFLKYTDYVGTDVPAGTMNGTNTTFTLANTPQANSLNLYKGGQLLKPGAGNDYTVSGATITMIVAPMAGDQLQASYFK